MPACLFLEPTKPFASVMHPWILRLPRIRASRPPLSTLCGSLPPALSANRLTLSHRPILKKALHTLRFLSLPQALVFKISQSTDEVGTSSTRVQQYRYPSMTKTMVPKALPAQEGGEASDLKPGQLDRRKFVLHVEAGTFTDSEIVVMLGENGTGKTTFVRMLAGALKSDEEEAALERGDEEEAEVLGVPSLNVSYKPQKIRYVGTEGMGEEARQLLSHKWRREPSHGIDGRRESRSWT